MIKEAIIPLAGLGTRLLPFSKILPKELLQRFCLGLDGLDVAGLWGDLAFAGIADVVHPAAGTA